ncbi:Transcription factor [Acorus gramineus]|uniref:Transcription factor n=1 Tax=Acorus gramineus TaxID=55184 RepID=A0AAV9B9H3_ACOGR|nr:Transcription factor [Acorus gramineus]
MEEQFNPLAITHLLQHTLRGLCISEGSQWIYAVFWRILPRNYPPPKWDLQGGMYDRSRGNRRNWILVWEDGFCNFAASSTADVDPTVYRQNLRGLQPEIFFKMSHEIYNYGEGMVGKVAADHSHKWVFNEPQEQEEINFLSAWNNPADSTIALIALREGVIQLGAINKVVEDLSYVVQLRKKFAYLESIPGVFLPHPSSSSSSAAAYPFKIDTAHPPDAWPVHHPMPEFYDHHHHFVVTPSMSSLEALLSKLPSVAPPLSAEYYYEAAPPPVHHQRPLDLMGTGGTAAAAKAEEDEDGREVGIGGEGSSSTMMRYHVNGVKPHSGF